MTIPGLEIKKTVQSHFATTAVDMKIWSQKCNFLIFVWLIHYILGSGMINFEFLVTPQLVSNIVVVIDRLRDQE